MARRVAQRKKIQKKLAHAQKTKSSSSPAPVQAPSRLSKKKKLTAAENKGLEAALKRVHAKNAVKEFEEARAAIIQ